MLHVFYLALASLHSTLQSSTIATHHHHHCFVIIAIFFIIIFINRIQREGKKNTYRSNR
jgi:hypothetical protein